MPLDEYYEWMAADRARTMHQPLYRTPEEGQRAYFASKTPKMKTPPPTNVER